MLWERGYDKRKKGFSGSGKRKIQGVSPASGGTVIRVLSCQGVFSIIPLLEGVQGEDIFIAKAIHTV